MPTWLDPYPGSPLVAYQHEDGSEQLVPRAQAQLLGFAAPAAPPPPVPPAAEAPGPLVPPPPVVAAPALAPGLPIGAPLPSGTPTPPAPAERLAAEQAAAKPAGELLRPPPAAPPSVPVVPEQRAPAPPVDTIPLGTLPDGSELVADIPRVSTSLGAPAPLADAPGAAPVQLGQDTRPRSREEIDQDLARARVQEIDATTLRLGEIQQRQQQLAADLDQQRTALTKRVGQAVERAADHRVDPARKYKDMGTGRTIMAYAMAAISGLGQALAKQGGANPALELIKAAIDRDVQLQLAEGDKLARDVQLRRQELSDFDGLVTDKMARLAGERAGALEAEARRFDRLAAQAASEDVRFKWQELRDGLRAAALDEAQKAAQTQFENELKFGKTSAEIEKLHAETRKILGQVGGGGGAGKPSYETSYASLDQVPPKFRDKAVMLPGVGIVLAKSVQAAKQADETIANTTKFAESIASAMTKVQKIPNFAAKLANRMKWADEDIAVIQNDLGQLIFTGKDFYHAGALDKGLVDAFSRLVKDPTAVSELNPQTWAQLENWHRGVTRGGRIELGQYLMRDVPDDTFGAPPKQPEQKRAASFVDELTAAPTFAGDGSLAYVPNRADAEQQIAGMREALLLEGKRDEDWRNQLGSAAAATRANKALVARKAAEVKAEIAKLTARGGKGAEQKVAQLRARQRELAGAFGSYVEVEKAIEKAKSTSIEKARKAQETAEKSRQRKADAGFAASRTLPR